MKILFVVSWVVTPCSTTFKASCFSETSITTGKTRWIRKHKTESNKIQGVNYWLMRMFACFGSSVGKGT